MATTLASTQLTPRANARRMMAILSLAAGLLGAASGIFLSVVPADVPDDRYSYPLTAGGFVAIQVWFAIQHMGLLAGQVELRRIGAGGTGRAARWGHPLGIAGMALLTITELLAISAAESTYPGERTGTLDVLYGISTIAIGVGLIAVGVAVLRNRTNQGWLRWLPLALGVYVFVPMSPAIAMGFLAARLSITGWMLLYAALGLALLRSQPRR